MRELLYVVRARPPARRLTWANGREAGFGRRAPSFYGMSDGGHSSAIYVPAPIRGTFEAVHEHAEEQALPGEELVERGIRDLEAGIESVEALLVSIGAPRLGRVGLAVPRPLREPERRLYDLLSELHGDAAHSRYNALVRRLVSFERAARVGAARDA